MRRMGTGGGTELEERRPNCLRAPGDDTGAPRGGVRRSITKMVQRGGVGFL